MVWRVCSTSCVKGDAPDVHRRGQRRRRRSGGVRTPLRALLREEELEGARAGALGNLERRLGLSEAGVHALQQAGSQREAVGVAKGDAVVVGPKASPEGVQDGGGGGEALMSLLVLPEAEVGAAEVAQSAALVLLVTDISADRERHRVVLDRLLGLPEAEVGVAAQIGALALPVANLAADRERHREVLDRLLGLPEAEVGDAEVAQIGALALLVANLAGAGGHRFQGGGRASLHAPPPPSMW